MGQPIEKWILKSDKSASDSGYTINNSDNGVWLPSIPTDHKKRKGYKPFVPWESVAKTKKNPSALQPDIKKQIAEYVMLKGEGQFHNGNHKIVDERQGPHYTYAMTVSERLSALEKFIREWDKACCCKDKKTPAEPTWKINEKLDLVSKWIEIDIKSSPPSSWTYFVSGYARDLTSRLSAASSVYK